MPLDWNIILILEGTNTQTMAASKMGPIMLNRARVNENGYGRVQGIIIIELHRSMGEDSLKMHPWTYLANIKATL